MAEDSFTETSSESWLSRLGGAFMGILFGLLLILGAVILLFWNEGRAVERYKTLKEGAEAVVSTRADQVDPAQDGELVHVTGQADSSEILVDETFGVQVPALRLERKVEMYQWKENKRTRKTKKTGGGTRTRTTYSYEKVWSEDVIDSGGFKDPGGHENPGAMPWETRRVRADRVTLGAYRLSPGLVEKIDAWQPLAVDSLEALPEGVRERARLHDGGVYVGEGDPSSPRIGDVRVEFRYVEPTEISVVAQQTGPNLSRYQADAGGTIALLELGSVPAGALFEAAQRSNTMLTWGLRAGGFFLMFLGLVLVFRPLSVLADVLPFLGNLVEAGTGVLSFLLAGLFSLVVIAVAWIFYRPLLTLILVLLAAGVVVLLVRRARKGREKRATAADTGAGSTAASTAATGSRPKTTEATPPPPPPPPSS